VLELGGGFAWWALKIACCEIARSVCLCASE
jgi:hypothetical protein